jgi:hypothetical protein
MTVEDFKSLFDDEAIMIDFEVTCEICTIARRTDFLHCTTKCRNQRRPTDRKESVGLSTDDAVSLDNRVGSPAGHGHGLFRRGFRSCSRTGTTVVVATAPPCS